MKQAGHEHVTQRISLVHADALLFAPQRQKINDFFSFLCLQTAISDVIPLIKCTGILVHAIVDGPLIFLREFFVLTCIGYHTTLSPRGYTA